MSSTGRGRSRIVIGVLVTVIIVTAVLGLRFWELSQDSAMASIRAEQETNGVPVEIVTAVSGNLDRWISLAGTVEGTVQYPIVSNNALRIVKIEVTEGDKVARGDVILRMADEAPNPMFHSVSRARASYANTLLDVKRMRNLYAEGAVSKQSLDAIETKLAVALSDLEDAEGSTVLTASQDGVVASILVTEGKTASPNKPLVWITNTDTVKIKFDVGSNQAFSMAVDQQARWTEPDGKQHTGYISQLDLMADPQTHLLAGEATFDNSDGKLLPGLLVSFRTRITSRNGVLSIPVGCLVENNEGSHVWVVVPNGVPGEFRAALRKVEQGMRTADLVEILTGIGDGERVVKHGQTLLREGVKVADVSAGKDA